MEWQGYVVVLVVFVVFLFARGFRQNSIDARRYKSQKTARRQVITELVRKGDTWEDIVLVLQHGGFKDHVGHVISTDHVRAEHVATVLDGTIVDE